MKLATLTSIWSDLNETLFSGILDHPDFRATRSKGEYASYVAGIMVQSTIYFNAKIIKGHWAQSIVYHEMCHQYLEEILEIEEEDHHGPEFWNVYTEFAPTDVILFEAL